MAELIGPRVAPGGFLNFRWGRGDELFVYVDESARQAARLANARAPPPSLPAGGSVALCWHGLTGARRKLATQLHSTFVRLGAAAASAAAAGRPRDEFSLVPFSREYRACVRQCIDELAKEEAAARARGADADGADADELAAEMEQHEWADCILHLCEIFFLERNAYVAEPLVRWVQLHVAQSAPAAETLARALVPEQADGYWPAVHRLLLHGRMVEARQLLGAHTALRAHLAQGAAGGGLNGGGGVGGAGAGAGASLGEGLSYLDLLIEHRPTLRGAEGLLDFRGSWRVWCEDAAALERRHAATLPAPALEAIRLLRGDVPTLCALARHWYELVLALLLHSQPTLRRTELEKLVNFAIASFPEDEYSEQDHLLMAVFLDDPKQALDIACAVYGRGWLLCHLTDLLQRAGQVEARLLDGAGSDHELTFCEYARALAASRGLWQLAAGYLAPLPRPLAGAWLAALVAAEPFATDGKAAKLLALCDAWGLEAQAASIATQMVLRKLRARMPAAALRWLGRTPPALRQQARCDAVSAALVRACNGDDGAPAAGPARGAPAAALARMLGGDGGGGGGGGGGLAAGGEAAGWVGEYCALSAALQALHGLRAPAAAATAAEHAQLAAAMASGEAEARARVLALCADGSELPPHMRAQVLVDAHAAGLLKAPTGAASGAQLSASDTYALIGCLHAHDKGASGHAGGEADGSLPGGLQPVALELCMTLASAILARPQADAVAM